MFAVQFVDDHTKADPKVIATTYEHDFNKARARAEQDYKIRHGAGGWRVLDATNDKLVAFGGLVGQHAEVDK